MRKNISGSLQNLCTIWVILLSEVYKKPDVTDILIIDGLLGEDKEYKGIIDKLFEDKQKVLEELDNQCREQRQQIIDSFEVNDWL